MFPEGRRHRPCLDYASRRPSRIPTEHTDEIWDEPVVAGDQGRNAFGKVDPEEVERDDLAGRLRVVVLAMSPPFRRFFVTGQMEEPADVDLVTTEGTRIETLDARATPRA